MNQLLFKSLQCRPVSVNCVGCLKHDRVQDCPFSLALNRYIFKLGQCLWLKINEHVNKKNNCKSVSVNRVSRLKHDSGSTPPWCAKKYESWSAQKHGAGCLGLKMVDRLICTHFSSPSSRICWLNSECNIHKHNGSCQEKFCQPDCLFSKSQMKINMQTDSTVNTNNSFPNSHEEIS